MITLLRRASAHTHAQNVREFADETILLWFPPARDSEDYSVGIPAVKGAIRMKAEGVLGMVSMPVDGLTASAAKADFPFDPETDDLFLKGPALSGDPARPDTERCVRFRILTASCLEMESHWRITAERQA